MIFAAASDDVAVAFIELGAIVLGLAVLARLSDRFGVSPIPAYLVAGLLFGDGGIATPELSGDFLKLAAEIGVVLLLLTLGLEYTPDELRDGLRRNGRAGLVDVVLNALPGAAAAFLLGWGPKEAVLLAGHHLHLVVGRDLEGPHRPRPDGKSGDAGDPQRPRARGPRDDRLPAGRRRRHRRRRDRATRR